MTETFRCLLADRDASGQVVARVTSLPIDRLPPGETLVRVAWSSLNFKDALSATGRPGVTKNYPHVPGIDAAGVVVEGGGPEFSTGDPVIVTGFDLGQNTWGGYSEYVRVPTAWLVRTPAEMTLRESMILGTAGLTAGLATQTFLDRGITPESGPVVVTGASGGVGCLAVAILAKIGFEVVAVSGKPAAAAILGRIGASRVAPRDEFDDRGGKPLLPAKWAGAVDTVGGNTLATLVRAQKRGGCVAACGLVGGTDLPLTVYPFLLRGVDLAGIDSAEPPWNRRLQVWRRLATDWKVDLPLELVGEVTLEGLADPIARILRGEIAGRVVARVANL